jgi:hypothetical protein
MMTDPVPSVPEPLRAFDYATKMMMPTTDALELV